MCYIIIINMFRAVPCSSSGEQIVLLQPLEIDERSSVKSRTVCRLRADSVRSQSAYCTPPSPKMIEHKIYVVIFYTNLY